MIEHLDILIKVWVQFLAYEVTTRYFTLLKK